jgi:beta-N-acetylhexosaminidase
MASPSLERAAAQLLTVGFFEQYLSDTLKGLVDRGVAGVVLFARNIDTPEQVAALTSSIKEYAGRPIYVGLDQEGGLVQRLRTGFTRIPPMRAIGSIGDELLAEELGRAIGRELRAVGVDVNYAPILDVDTNPNDPIIGNRSFGRDAQLVARLGVALGRGMESVGVAACGKHFPGHGDTEQDSHQELPRLSHSLERLRRVELVPFRAWSEAKLASVMTAHVIFEPLDPEYPATMSKPVLDGILRRELGYEGLIITDDIEMKAIADHFGYEEAAILGVNAGVDNFLCCHTASVAHDLIDHVVRAVLDGRVNQERLLEANQRTAAFVKKWAVPHGPADLSKLSSNDTRVLIEEIQARADPSTLRLGDDPTEIMEQIRVERMRAQAEQQ